MATRKAAGNKFGICLVVSALLVPVAGTGKSGRVAAQEEARPVTILADHQGIAVVRRPGQIDSDIIDGVAQFGSQQEVRVPQGTNLAIFILQKCGAFSDTIFIHPTYLKRLRALNASLTREQIYSTDIRSVLLPACAPFALRSELFDVSRGVRALVEQIGAPFDFELFIKIANSRDWKLSITAKFEQLLGRDFEERRSTCPQDSLPDYFACVNTIEFLYNNRDKIDNANIVRSPVRFAATPVAASDARIPVSKEIAGYALGWLRIEDSGKNAYREQAGLPGIIPIPEENGRRESSPLPGIEALNITLPNSSPLIPKPRIVAKSSQGLSNTAVAAAPTELVPNGDGQAVPAIRVALEPDVKFVGAVVDVGKYGEACSAAHLARKGAWPFDPGKFMRAWALNRRATPNPGSTKLLVVDSGLDFVEEPGKTILEPERHYFPKRNFIFNETDQDFDQEIDRDDDGIKANLGWAGVNLALGRRSAATSNLDPNRSHGLSVVELLLGGRGLEYFRNIAGLPVNLGIASLVPPDTENYVLSREHITKGLDYANKGSFKILNLSLSTRTAPAGADLAALLAQGLVIVAAAGNEGKAISEDTFPLWPAIKGGKHFGSSLRDTAFVTVGAHDAKNQLARFSNHGSRYVDVLAPGCMVPSFELRRVGGDYSNPLRVTQAYVTGTSFAAPTVSFLVALIMSDPSLSTPGHVKERILIGTDFEPKLHDAVLSSGVVNVEKVLGHRYDIIEVKDGENRRTYFGKLEKVADNSALDCNSRKIEFGKIRKIAFDVSTKLWLIMYRESAAPSSFEREICPLNKLPGGSFELRDAETGDIQVFPADVVIDFIRRG